MKKLSFVLIVFFLFFLVPKLVSADMAPPNSNLVERCVKITNLDKFPDIILIGYITGPMIKDHKTYEIRNNECLTKGYKFNSLKIYWNNKENADSIDQKKLLINNLEVDNYYVQKGNDEKSENIEYALVQVPIKKIALVQTKKTIEYEGDKQLKVSNFSYEKLFVYSLLLTLVTESLTVLFLMKIVYKNRSIKNIKIIFTCFLVSTITLLLFWFLIPLLISNYLLYLLLSESLIILIEAIIYQKIFKIKFLKAFILSSVANILSALLGFFFIK